MTASDDVIAAHRPAPNVLVHRPRNQDELQPACAAVNSDGPWMHFAAGYARSEMAPLCHESACFPQGWSTP